MVGAMTAAAPTPAAFVAAARGFLRVPWRHLGRDQRGLDCAGLLVAAAAACGLPAPPALAYAPLPDLDLFERLLPACCTALAAPQIGAVLRLRVAGRAQHLAVAGDYHGGGLSLIHAYMTAGCVCEHAFDARWRRRLVSCWLPRGVH